MFRAILFITTLSLFFLGEISTLNITVGLTYNNLNMTNVGIILSQNLPLSQCPVVNYSISFVTYNNTPLFQTPLGFNDFQNTYLVFGPDRYFSPVFFGFNSSNTGFIFNSSFRTDYALDLATRYQIMVTVVNASMQNDAIKSAIFILNSSTVSPLQPWQAFNPHQYLTTLNGAITVFNYFNSSDADRICLAIKSMAATNIIVDLNNNASITLLNACNKRNLLNWRLRWMVFFSLLPNQNTLSQMTLPLSNNLTFFDYGRLSGITSFSITSDTEVLIYDVCYTLVKLMDYQNCNQPMPSTLSLGTGTATFTSGQLSRSSWVVQAYRYVNSIQTVGNITVSDGVVTVNIPPVPNVFNRSLPAILTEMKSKPFRIAAMIESPFVISSPNGTLTGYSVDTINLILSKLNLTGIITPYNLSTGTLKNGQFSGILGVLQSGLADIAIGPITSFPSYLNYMNFTIPFKTYQLAIIYNFSQTSIYQDMFQFIFAFTWPVWILIVGSCLVYAVALFVVNLISPNEANMSLLDTFFFTMGSMVQGVTTALPDKFSGRILVIFWWILNICILLAYVCSYGATTTSNRLQSTINTYTDLFLQTRYSYGTVTNSSVDEFLATSTDPAIQYINTIMRSVYIQKMTNSTSASMALVNAGLFAFIYQDAILNQYMINKCLTLTNGFNQFNYVYALMDSDYTTVINSQLTNLINSNELAQLNAKYFPQVSQPKCVDSDWLGAIMNVLTTEFIANQTGSLNIRQTAGIFIIMLIGIILALIVSVGEFIYNKVHQKKNPPGESSA